MSQGLPKISVITVCLNAEKAIKRTIESVLVQSYSSLEYIIIDGESTDGTKQIVESFGSRINCFVSEKDTGIYDAMNKGIGKATGDLIIFLNAGDYYVSPNVLSYAFNKMNFEKADVFFARFLWEDVTKKEIILSDNFATQFDWDLKNSNFPHPATFYKKSIFSRIGTFNEAYKILGDYEWNARALVKHRVIFQYIDVITALFSTDGISNSDRNRVLIDAERSKIIQEYFRPSWLFGFVSGFGHSQFLKKVIAKIYSKRLNRSW